MPSWQGSFLDHLEDRINLAVHDINAEHRAGMGILDLKTRLRDVPGIETLTMQMVAGQQHYNVNGHDVVVSAGASDFEVEQAIRALPAVPVPVAPVAAVAPAPAGPVTLTPPVSQGSSTMTTPGAHALTIKDALANHAQKLDQILSAQLALLTSTLDGQLDTVSTGTAAVISKVQSHTDDFKAILGQFTNEL